MADGYHRLKVTRFFTPPVSGPAFRILIVVGYQRLRPGVAASLCPPPVRIGTRAKSGCAAVVILILQSSCAISLAQRLEDSPISKLYRYCAGTNRCWIVSGPPTELGSLFHFSQHLLDELGTGCWQNCAAMSARGRSQLRRCLPTCTCTMFSTCG